MKTRAWGSGWTLVGLWLFTAVIVLLLQSWLFEANFLISLASLPLLLMVGIGVFIVLLATKAWKSALAFVAATVLIALLPLNAFGHQAWTRISFAQHRTTYERIVGQAPNLPDQGTFDGVSYRKDGGRIAFPRSHGMPDGWSAVVHDPTNNMPTSEGTRMIAFGSNYQSCIRIERDWYRCWFD